MITRVYIDGFNLYYGLLKGRSPCKWLDLKLFAKSLLDCEHVVDAVYFFTSNVKTHPFDQSAIERQNVYLQALKARGGVEIVYGLYNKRKCFLPALDQKCRDCAQSGERELLHVMKFEEKRTDVNLATRMLRDAYTTDVESFVLISGDSDFIAPLDLIRRELGKQVVVFNPKEIRSDLSNHASFYRDIPRDLPARCQLPDEIPVGTRGNFIRRPAAWK